MFESAEIGHSIPKEIYDQEAPVLREALLEVQFELGECQRFPVIILIAGVDGAGKGETVNLLNEWMDPRHIQTNAMGLPTEEELERPHLWRFWRALPARGKIGIFFGSWYTQPILLRTYGRSGDADLDRSMEEVVRFERMLTEEGALLLKFWFHLSKEQQRLRLKSLERDPKTRWRVTPTDWKHFKLYDEFVPICERALRQTSAAEAPWTIVEGADAHYRSLTVGRAILDAVQKRLAAPSSPKPQPPAPPAAADVDNLQILNTVDLALHLKRKKYRSQLLKYQAKLNLLSRHPRFKDLSVVAVFEGFDAAGKGGAIRRVTGALDARQYRVIPVAAPTDEERAQPYLWRFWRHQPRRGSFAIFDRSWYGRVLVERVEGFCSQTDWMRAYGEINDFEDQMVRHDVVVAKFWLTLGKDEQLQRFREREETSFKHYKITEEDWRNRERWDDYQVAVSDMIARTSPEIAPWTIVEANDKLFARIKVLRTLCSRLEKALKPSKRKKDG